MACLAYRDIMEAADALEPAVAATLVAACLRSLPHARLRVKGTCMAPSLDDGDTVLLASPSSRPARMGDVVLVRLKDGLRLHRLVWGPPLARPGRAWRTQADSGAIWDAAVSPAAILAVAAGVERSGGVVPVGSLGRCARSLSRGLVTWLVGPRA
jgi:hypothetical protein